MNIIFSTFSSWRVTYLKHLITLSNDYIHMRLKRGYKEYILYVFVIDFAIDSILVLLGHITVSNEK